MSINLKKAIATIVPFLGSLLEGPLEKAVEETICQVLLGRSKAEADELMKALVNATQEQLAKLKHIASDCKAKIAELDLDEAKLRAVAHAELIVLLHPHKDR